MLSSIAREAVRCQPRVRRGLQGQRGVEGEVGEGRRWEASVAEKVDSTGEGAQAAGQGGARCCVIKQASDDVTGVRLTDSECPKRVSPGGEVGCWRVLRNSRTAETKSAMAQKQVGARPRTGAGDRHRRPQCEAAGEAAQNVAVMFGSEHSCECGCEQPKTVVHARRRTEQQQ